VFIPRLVQFLSYAADALLLLLMAWNIGNLFYPIWSTATFVALWIGLVTHPFFFWLIERFRLRSAIVPKFKPIGPDFKDRDKQLKYLGFLYSVWNGPEAFFLAYYGQSDGYFCPRERGASLSYTTNFNMLLGWLVVVLTDAIPVALLVGLVSAGYYFGFGALVFFSMGLILAFQLQTLNFRFREASYYWEVEMLLGETVRATKSLGIMTCVLEGSDGELFLGLSKSVEYDHYVRYYWLLSPGGGICKCCPSTSYLTLPSI
jgi:hypothetical protein